jgi:hypothetical protein
MHDEMNRPDDHEAKMARADLFKLAQYSFKLFKMIRDDQELEGWVQAKITKSADYIASVYHYMQYEMKVSEYGDHLENSEMYSESIRRVFAQKLEEAKAKAERIKEEMKVGDTKKTATGELTKTSTGVVHKRTDFSDEEHGEAPSKVKQKSAAEKKADKDKEVKLPKHKGNTWGMKGGEKFGKKMEGVMAPSDPDGATAPPPKGKDGKYPVVVSGPHKGKRWSPQTPGPTNPAMKEGAKPDFLDMDKDGNKKEPMKKAVADKKKGAVKEASVKCNHTPKGKSCPVHGLKECGGMYEATKKAKKDYDGDGKIESGKDEYLGSKIAAAKKAGKIKEGVCPACKKTPCTCTKESTGDYSAKKAAAGKDIGKPGKNFAKIASKSGGGEKGKKIAGAVLAKLRAKG